MKPLTSKAHVKPGICSTANCNRKTKGKLCNTCRCRKSRLSDPVRYAYNNMKNRAKQRKKIFTITLDQFRTFCRPVKYIGFAGRSADSLTVDCIINELGYADGNLQILPKGENVKKYFYYDYRSKSVRFDTPVNDSAAGPF